MNSLLAKPRPASGEKREPFSVRRPDYAEMPAVCRGDGRHLQALSGRDDGRVDKSQPAVVRHQLLGAHEVAPSQTLDGNFTFGDRQSEGVFGVPRLCWSHREGP
jgi:hypothetical protein